MKINDYADEFAEVVKEREYAEVTKAMIEKGVKSIRRSDAYARWIECLLDGEIDEEFFRNGLQEELRMMEKPNDKEIVAVITAKEVRARKRALVKNIGDILRESLEKKGRSDEEIKRAVFYAKRWFKNGIDTCIRMFEGKEVMKDDKANIGGKSRKETRV